MKKLNKKDEKNKLPIELIDPVALKTLAKVIGYGNDKYDGLTFEHGSIDQYIGSLYRHLLEYQSGEDIDPESNLHHLEHLFANAYIMLLLAHNDEQL